MRKALLFFVFLPYTLYSQLPNLIPYKKGNLWGYSDSNGILKLSPQWEKSLPFDTNGLAIVHLKAINTYKRKNKLVSDTFVYRQLINKKGEYLVSPQRVIELIKSFELDGHFIYGFSNEKDLDFRIDESKSMQFDIKGNLKYYVTGAEITTIKGLNSHGYALNRKTMEYKKKGRHWRDGIYFTDRFGNQISKIYDGLYDEDYLFNKYYLYILYNWTTGDSMIVNPNGPVACVVKGKYYLFVDTFDKVVYKLKKRDKDVDIDAIRHPLDTIYQKNGSFKSQNMDFISFYNLFDTSKPFIKAWASKGVEATKLEHWRSLEYVKNFPFAIVKLKNQCSLMDTIGQLMFPFKYREIQHYLDKITWAYDTSWHWINVNGEIIFEEFRLKNYTPVLGTNMSLFFDARRGVYIDKYGREYYE